MRWKRAGSTHPPGCRHRVYRCRSLKPACYEGHGKPGRPVVRLMVQWTINTESSGKNGWGTGLHRALTLCLPSVLYGSEIDHEGGTFEARVGCGQSSVPR